MVFSEITGFGNYCSLSPETWQIQTTYEVNKGVSIQGQCHFMMTGFFDEDIKNAFMEAIKLFQIGLLAMIWDL